jgi:hypothetical protein
MSAKVSNISKEAMKNVEEMESEQANLVNAA